MKFMRRPDLDNLTRVEIAVQAFLGLGVYGEFTRVARFYQVSRLFVYKLLWQLMLLYQLEACDPSSSEAIRKEVDRHLLLLRLEGHCALERISQINKQLGLPFSSVGYLSQRLRAYARALPQDVLTGARIAFLLCDEIFTLGQPILITVEPPGAGDSEDREGRESSSRDLAEALGRIGRRRVDRASNCGF